jgi:hypothetical protein
MILAIFDLTRKSLKRVYEKNWKSKVGAVILLLVFLELVFILRAFYSISDLQEAVKAFRPVAFLFSPLLSGDFWSYEKLAYLPYLFMALVGSLFLLDSKQHHRYDYLWFLFIPLFLVLLGLLPRSWGIGQAFTNEKALNGVASVVYTLAAISFFVGMNSVGARLKKWAFLSMNALILFSMVSSFMAIKILYPLKADADFIAAVRWLELQPNHEKTFVLFPYLFKPDKDANDQVFYTLSFIPSTIPFTAMRDVNEGEWVEKDFELFKANLKKSGATYLFLEETYPIESINEKLKNLGKVVYEGTTSIVIKL